jgi:hypothetical protein
MTNGANYGTAFDELIAEQNFTQFEPQIAATANSSATVAREGIEEVVKRKVSFPKPTGEMKTIAIAVGVGLLLLLLAWKLPTIEIGLPDVHTH